MENKRTLDDSKFPRSGWLVLLLFGAIGQIAWAVENMYFNLFVYETIAPDLNTVTLMVQLSGIVATLTTLVAGVMSDKLGNRRGFISIGYAIWGITVALFGCLSPELVGALLGLDAIRAMSVTLTLVVVGDCVMTLFGSTANDAAYNAWVTDNTEPAYRGRIESIVAMLPLAAMLIVAGGFGILVSAVGYRTVFILLGTVISASGIVGLFVIKDSTKMERSGTFRDIFYGFRPSVVRENLPLYTTLLAVLVYGIACQVFMPYLIIFMSTYLGFSVLEYSIVFGGAIIVGAVINIFLGKLSDKMDKTRLLYFAAGIFAAGLLFMYFASMIKAKLALILFFGLGGFVMIVGYIFISALCGSTTRDYTPSGSVGKLQGVRMVFSVLIPMLVGPALGNAINRSRGVKLPNLDSADVMTTEYIPAPEIFLVAALISLLLFAVIPLISGCVKAKGKKC